MGFFNFNRNKNSVKETPSVETKTISTSNKIDVDNVMNFAMETSLPNIKEQHSKEWVTYRTDEGEEYPLYLEKLYNNSPSHQAIIDTKSLIVAGDGYEVDSSNLTSEQEMELNKMLDYFDGKKTIEDCISEMVKHKQLYGAIALEVIWSLDFSKIVKINVINPKHIRSGKFVDGEVDCYYYSRDWSDRREDISKIAAFDVNDQENHRQLLYVGSDMVANEYYYEPQYLASVNWIYLEAQTGLFYSSLLENGFNPSLIVKFFRKPSTWEEKRDIVKGLKDSFGGIKNSGKAIVMFSQDKESAAQVEPISVSNLDKQFTTIASQITEKILTGHKVTTPSMFGIAIPGKLGDSNFDTQVEFFTKFVIQPDQKFINRLINKLFKLNGLDVDFKIVPLELDTINKTE